MSNAAQVVSTLIGEKYVELALECLGSLCRHSDDPLAIQVHDDGTLGERSRSRLRDHLPIHGFIGRAEADAWASGALTDFPASRRFRDECVYGLKLFDAAHFHPGASIAFCDCDILFLRSFAGLFAFDGPATDFLFMQDVQEAYALRPWNLVGSGALRLVSRINGGLFLIRRAALDPSSFERMLAWGYSRFKRPLPWFEQNCWASLARVDNTRLWRREDILIPSGMESIKPGPVALHLTSSVRGLLGAARKLKASPSGPSRLRTEPARRLSLTGFCLSEARRIVRNRLLQPR